MLDVYHNEAKRVTTAVIKDTEYDAFNLIAKRFLTGEEEYYGEEIPCADSAIMCNRYSAIVTCDERDKYDTAIGEDMAVKKAMDNHNRGLKKAILRWQAAMIKKVREVSPETFEAALHSVHSCSCNK